MEAYGAAPTFLRPWHWAPAPCCLVVLFSGAWLRKDRKAYLLSWKFCVKSSSWPWLSPVVPPPEMSHVHWSRFNNQQYLLQRARAQGAGVPGARLLRHYELHILRHAPPPYIWQRSWWPRV